MEWQRFCKCIRLTLWLAVSAAALLLAAELHARFCGFGPAGYDSETELQYYVLTDTHGHVPRRGIYNNEEVTSIRELVWPNNQRASRPLPWRKKDRYRIALYGCSYTYGYGVEDQDSYPWVLNQAFPGILFDNYGVPDYGTWLSYLTMRDNFSKKRRYDLSIYAFIYDHIFRNGAMLYQGDIISNEILEFPGYKPGYLQNPPHLRRVDWEGETSWAVVHRLHKICVHAYLKQQVRLRWLPYDQQDDYGKVFRELNLAMRDLARANGSDFAVLAIGPQSAYLAKHYLSDTHINVIYALSSPDTSLYNELPGTHPNKKGQKEIADSIADYLRRHLPEQLTHSAYGGQNSPVCAYAFTVNQNASR
ncbi:hypothetical protein IJT17_01295 [bacterium]|nr:hypothetical protein [bacterium]